MSNIILCGLPMCGKTTIGSLLARRLDCSFIDTDQEIEALHFARYGRTATCREIFQKEGESFFRNLEKESIRTLESTVRSVIAVGGGALVDEENRTHLARAGTLVYLDVNLAEIIARVTCRGIPAFIDAADYEMSLTRLASEREPLYAAASSLQIACDKLSREEIVESIVQSLNRENAHGK